MYPPGTDNALALCPICEHLIGDKKPYQLIVIGPTDDEDREKHNAEEWYPAGALIGHKACVATRTGAGLDELASQFVVMKESEPPSPR